MNEQDLVDRKEADRAYHDALHALKMDHDHDLVQLTAQMQAGEIVFHTFAMRKLGIKRRYERDAKRLATQHGKEGHDGQ